MGVFRQFPYSNFHEMNMDDIIKIIKNMLEEWAQYYAKWDAWMNEINENWSNYQDVMNEAWQNMQDFINNYFDNLDVQNEINNKITSMINDGTFGNIVAPYIPARVTEWLTAHITQPVGVVIDTSLTISGACADAKAAGDAIFDLTDEFDVLNNDVSSIMNDAIFRTLTTQKYIDGDGTIKDTSNSSYGVTQYVDVENYNFVYYCASASTSHLMLAFYDETYAYVTGLNGTGAYEVNKTIEIPYGVKYVVLAQDGNGAASCVLKKYYYPFIEAINDNFSDEYETITGTTTNAYINYTGSIISTTGAYRTLTAPVTPGDQVKINAYAGYYNYYFVFYDISDNIISGYKAPSDTERTITDFVTIVPDNAVKIAVAGSTTSPSTPNIAVYNGSVPSISLKWSGKKWVCFGDSLTAVNTRTDIHYFDYVSEATGITVVNKGVSGSGYRNDAGVNGAFYQKVSECPVDADVVTIFGSFNDGITDLGTATDSGTTTVGGCINTTIDNLYAVLPTVQLGIISPTPWVGANPYNHSEYNVYTDLLEEICKRRSIPFLNLYYESNLRPWDATFRTLAYSKDDGNGVHPDETGHAIIAPRFEGFLDSLLI